MNYLDVWARHFARSEQLNKQWSRDLRNSNATFKFCRVIHRLITTRRQLDDLFAAQIEGRNPSFQRAQTVVAEYKLLAEQYRILKEQQ